MYTPRFNRVDDEPEIRAFVASMRAAWVITTGAEDGPDATLLPIVWQEDRVVAHFAIANPHWRRITDGQQVLLVVQGPDAYVSPRWYASKAEHGRVVPTWNYEAVQLRGTATIHQDPAWLRAAVALLSDTQEASADEPWQIDDAPAAYVDGQLRGIVGLEVQITSVDGKAKLSQNRSRADQEGVVAGMRAETADHLVADAMQRRLDTSDR